MSAQTILICDTPRMWPVNGNLANQIPGTCGNSFAGRTADTQEQVRADAASMGWSSATITHLSLMKDVQWTTTHDYCKEHTNG